MNSSSRIFLSITLATGLFVLAFLSAFQLLLPLKIPHSPNEDLARHVALAINFRDAVFEGQYVPRLQQGKQGVIPDIPVFQYYGFLSSLFALPGMLLGLSSMHALIWGVVIIRWIAAIAIYFTCRIQNMSLQASVLAVTAWLFFPYIQSNLYGRAAIPETFAQSILAFIPLSWALTVRYSKGIVVLSVILTVVLLALAHPIFLMWGAAAIGMMVFAAIILNRRASAEALLVGLLLGVCVSSFQWLPAYMSSQDLSSLFLSSSPFGTAYLTSPSGFIGWPKVLLVDKGEFYFSVSLWFAPALAGAIVYLYKKTESRADVLLNVVLLLIFTFLAYSPLDFWQFLPKSTWATQFPYRLLSFVAIFGAINLGYTCEILCVSGRWINMIIIAALIIIFTGPALIAPGSVRVEGLSNSINISSIFASQDYIVTNNSKYLSGDGWLMRENIIHLPATQYEKYLCLEARSGMPYAAGVNLQVINSVTKENVVEKMIHIPASGIKTQIRLQHGVNFVSLVPDTFFVPAMIDSNSADRRELSIIVSTLYICNNGTSQILPSEIDRKVISPYSRSFWFSRENNVTQTQYTARLPLAYSRFQKISQGSSIVRSEPTYDGSTLVYLDDIEVPVISYYYTPAVSRILVVSGFVLLMMYLLFRGPLIHSRSMLSRNAKNR